MSLPLPVQSSQVSPSRTTKIKESLINMLWRLLDATPAIGMVLFLVLSSWVNLYWFCWRQLINFSLPAGIGLQLETETGGPFLGWLLLITLGVFRFTWVGAWVQMLVITWFFDRKWRPPTTCKNIMQLEVDSLWRTRESDRGPWLRYEESKSRPYPYPYP